MIPAHDALTYPSSRCFSQLGQESLDGGTRSSGEETSRPPRQTANLYSGDTTWPNRLVRARTCFGITPHCTSATSSMNLRHPCTEHWATSMFPCRNACTPAVREGAGSGRVCRTSKSRPFMSLRSVGGGQHMFLETSQGLLKWTSGIRVRQLHKNVRLQAPRTTTTALPRKKGTLERARIKGSGVRSRGRVLHQDSSFSSLPTRKSPSKRNVPLAAGHHSWTLAP